MSGLEFRHAFALSLMLSTHCENLFEFAKQFQYCKPLGGPPTLFWTLDPEPCTLDLGSRTLNLFVNRFVMHWLLLCSTLGAFWAILVSSWDHFGSLQSHLGSSWAILGNPGAILGLAWVKLVLTLVLLAPKITLLKCKNRSRSVLVESNRVCLNTQVQP